MGHEIRAPSCWLRSRVTGTQRDRLERVARMASVELRRKIEAELGAKVDRIDAAIRGGFCVTCNDPAETCPICGTCRGCAVPSDCCSVGIARDLLGAVRAAEADPNL